MIKTERPILRQPEQHEVGAVIDYYKRNAAHRAPWEPHRAPNFYTEAYWLPILTENREELRQDVSARFFVLMANYQPNNERGARLLASLGFEEEGRAPRYLLLGGDWCDHVSTAKVAPVWPPPGPAST